jgi:hypothetical protein
MKGSLAPVAPGAEDAWFAVLQWRPKPPDGGSGEVAVPAADGLSTGSGR